MADDIADLIAEVRRLDREAPATTGPVSDLLTYYRTAALRLADECERLRNKLNADSQNFEIECKRAESLLLRERVRELEAALRPFAGYTGECLDYVLDDLEPEDADALRGALLRAREALKGGE